MRKAPRVDLDIEVRKELERLRRSRSTSGRLAERSRIVLLAAEGLRNEEIAARLDMTLQKVGRWRARFVKHGLGGIEKDAPPKRTYSVNQRAEAGPDRKEDD